MGKKKKNKALKKERVQILQVSGIEALGKVKSKCCKNYKKSERKRCKKCPCFDLIQKVA